MDRPRLNHPQDLSDITAALQVNHKWINKEIKCKVVCMTPHHIQTNTCINFGSGLTVMFYSNSQGEMSVLM